MHVSHGEQGHGGNGCGEMIKHHTILHKIPFPNGPDSGTLRLVLHSVQNFTRTMLLAVLTNFTYGPDLMNLQLQ